MKTFNEWLELREAGFFSGLFGKGASRAEEALRRAKEAEAERTARSERESRARDSANYDASMAMLLGKGVSDDKPVVSTADSSATQSTAARWPRDSVGSSPFGELYDLVGEAGDGVSSIMDKIKSRPNKSLTDSSNRSDMYDIYYKLSVGLNSGKNLLGLSDSDCSRAVRLIESMFKSDLGYETFPDKEIVAPYVDLSPENATLVHPGLFEKPAKVWVKGFKKGGRTMIKTRVSYRGMGE